MLPIARRAALSALLAFIARSHAQSAEASAEAADQEQGEAEVCSLGSKACDVQANAARAAGGPLRWRVQSYHEGRKSHTYGGSYVAESLSRRFEGPVDGDDWDVLWSTSYETGELEKRKLPLRPGRLVNKCRYWRAAGNKCYYAGHLRRVEKALEAQGKSFNYLRNYVITHRDQHLEWRQEVTQDPSRPWVVKKCASGMSQGVKLLSGDALLSKAKAKNPKQWTVAQAYLERPYMGFGNAKFHLRVYALVTHWGPPPRVFIFNEGVVFRSRKTYDHKDLSQDRDIFSAISEKAEALTHSTFWRHLEKDAPGATAQAKARMVEVIGQIFGTSLHESFGEDRIKETYPSEYGYQCFDLFGLDVMFDEDLIPYVLEVNMGPNLNIDDRGDQNENLLEGVKSPMIDQMVHWMELYIRGAAAAALEGGPPFDPEVAENATLVNFTRVL